MELCQSLLSGILKLCHPPHRQFIWKPSNQGRCVNSILLTISTDVVLSSRAPPRFPQKSSSSPQFRPTSSSTNGRPKYMGIPTMSLILIEIPCRIFSRPQRPHDPRDPQLTVGPSHVHLITVHIQLHVHISYLVAFLFMKTKVHSSTRSLVSHPPMHPL